MYRFCTRGSNSRLAKEENAITFLQGLNIQIGKHRSTPSTCPSLGGRMPPSIHGRASLADLDIRTPSSNANRMHVLGHHYTVRNKQDKTTRKQPESPKKRERVLRVPVKEGSNREEKDKRPNSTSPKPIRTSTKKAANDERCKGEQFSLKEASCREEQSKGLFKRACHKYCEKK